jgi:hypothetical protein
MDRHPLLAHGCPSGCKGHWCTSRRRARLPQTPSCYAMTGWRRVESGRPVVSIRFSTATAVVLPLMTGSRTRQNNELRLSAIPDRLVNPGISLATLPLMWDLGCARWCKVNRLSQTRPLKTTRPGWRLIAARRRSAALASSDEAGPPFLGPRDSGYCRKIRNHPAHHSDLKRRQMRERALFRLFSAIRHTS